MADAEPPEDAFSVLANETRLRVIEAIGEASGGGEYAALSYGTLRDAVGIEDTGNLNYHLRKLRDRFVEKSGDRYRLTIPGIRVYQAISSGMFDERQTIEPQPIHLPCDTCGEPMYVSYSEGRFTMECRTCEQVQQRYPILPNTFDPDDPMSLYTMASRRINSDNWQMISGICPYCSGQMDHEFDPGGDHTFESDEFPVVILASCRLCRWYAYITGHTVSYCHPSLQLFFLERGIDAMSTVWIPYADVEEELISRDPWRFEVRTSYQDDLLKQVFDENLDAIEWEVLEDVSLV